MRLPEYLRDWCTNAGWDWQVADRLHLRAPPFDARHIDPRRGLAKQNRANEISSLNESLTHLNNAANLLDDRVLPFHEEHDLPALRIMTDRGTEYCGRVDKHDFQLFVAINDIDHTKTKVKSPQTNGICERFQKMILQEFYQAAFRRVSGAPTPHFCADA